MFYILHNIDVESVKRLSSRLIQYKVRNHCKGKVVVYTDEYSIYRRLKNMLKVKSHKTVTHSEYENAVDDTHINTAENRHSLLRPFLNMYRGVSKKIFRIIREIHTIQT